MKLKIKLFFFVIILLISFSCSKKEEKDKNKLKADLKSVTTNTIILNGVKFTNSKNGKVVWELIADKAKIDKNKNIAELTEVYIKFYKKSIEAKSAKGLYYLKSKNGELIDNVTIYSKLWKIKSNEAFLDNRNRMIILNSKFKFFGKGFYVNGSRLKLLIDEKRFLINGRVKSMWSKK